MEPLSQTFIDYELLGAHQAISMLYLLDFAPDLSSVQASLQEVERGFPEVIGRIQLEERIFPGSEREAASAIFQEGIAYNEFNLRVVVSRNNGSPLLHTILHHSFCDGMGGVELLKRLFIHAPSRDLDQEKLQLADWEKQERSRCSIRQALALATHHLTRPAEVNSRSWSPKREVHFFSLELDLLREKKRALGRTLNDLYLLGVSGVLERAYPERELSHVLVPVNLRPKALQYTLGNHLLVYPLPLLHRGTPLERLASIGSHSEPLRDLSLLAPHLSARILVSRLPRVLRRFALKRIAETSTCIATFVPQNSPERKLGGATVLEQYPFPALLPGQELGFGLATYRGKFSIGMVTGGRFIGRAQEFERAFREMLSAELGLPLQRRASEK